MRSPRKSTAASTANSGVTFPAAPDTAGPSRSLPRTARIDTTTGKTQPTPAKIKPARQSKPRQSTKISAASQAATAELPIV
jgi:hypothetical protein